MTNEQRRERNSTAYLAMDREINDLVRMARATCLLVELYDEHRRAEAARGDISGAELVKFTDQWFQAADFSVRHLSEMANALMRHYA